MNICSPLLTERETQFKDHDSHVDCWIEKQQLKFRKSSFYRSMRVWHGLSTTVRVEKNGLIKWRNANRIAGPYSNYHPEARIFRDIEATLRAAFSKAKRLVDLPERRQVALQTPKKNANRTRKLVYQLAVQPNYQSQKGVIASAKASAIARAIGISARQVRRYLEEIKADTI